MCNQQGFLSIDFLCKNWLSIIQKRIKFCLQIFIHQQTMKKQQEHHFSFEVKQLHKKFKILDQPSIRLIFQFCQFDITRATKVLIMANDMKSPMAVVKKLYDRPEDGQDFVYDLCTRFDKKYGKDFQLDIPDKNYEQKKQVTEQKGMENIQRLKFPFFKEVPEDVIITLMNFMDPYSFMNLSFTCSLMYGLSRSQALFDYYKRLCMILFDKYQPNLPNPSRFMFVKQYVLARPRQFSPNTRNFVENQLSYFIWKVSPESFKLDSKYYLSFGSYRNLFEKCPRANFNGYYLCRQRYIKIGQRGLEHAFAPIIIIYYYRYLRFFADNSVLYYVSPKKLKKEMVQQVLSAQKLKNPEGQVIVGEFIQFKDKILVKAVKGNSIYSFNLQIKSSENKISNELFVNEYALELIDEAEIIQKLFVGHENKEQMVFEYNMDQQLRKQNQARIVAASL